MKKTNKIYLRAVDPTGQYIDGKQCEIELPDGMDITVTRGDFPKMEESSLKYRYVLEFGEHEHLLAMNGRYIDSPDGNDRNNDIEKVKAEKITSFVFKHIPPPPPPPLKEKTPVAFIRLSDGEKFLKNKNGTYSMNGAPFYGNLEYTEVRLSIKEFLPVYQLGQIDNYSNHFKNCGKNSDYIEECEKCGMSFYNCLCSHED